jgi:hypothetical protein
MLGRKTDLRRKKYNIVAQLYGMPHGILQVFILIFYENPAIIPTQVSLSSEQSTLVLLDLV